MSPAELYAAYAERLFEKESRAKAPKRFALRVENGNVVRFLPVYLFRTFQPWSHTPPAKPIGKVPEGLSVVAWCWSEGGRRVTGILVEPVESEKPVAAQSDIG